MTGLRLFGASVALLVGFTVAFSEAEAAAKNKKKDASGQFKQLDTNNDGKLSRDEFSKFGKAGKEKQANKLFAKLDENNDGSISMDEFKKVGELKKKKNK